MHITDPEILGPITVVVGWLLKTGYDAGLKAAKRRRADSDPAPRMPRNPPPPELTDTGRHELPPFAMKEDLVRLEKRIDVLADQVGGMSRSLARIEGRLDVT